MPCMHISPNSLIFLFSTALLTNFSTFLIRRHNGEKISARSLFYYGVETNESFKCACATFFSSIKKNNNYKLSYVASNVFLELLLSRTINNKLFNLFKRKCAAEAYEF
jgi:hypothetical protein